MQIELLIEVVDELIGCVEPYGDSAIDEKIRKNVEKATELYEHLSYMLQDVAEYVDRQEGSMNEIGQIAHLSLYNVMKNSKRYFEARE